MTARELAGRAMMAFEPVVRLAVHGPRGTP